MQLPKSLQKCKDPIKRRKQKAEAQARYRKTLKGKETKKRYQKGASGRKTKIRYTKKWRERNAVKHATHKIVFYALKNGVIKKGVCEVCGDIKTHAHHDDYAKPLDVRWLCGKHHNEIHCFVRYKEVTGRDIIKQ